MRHHRSISLVARPPRLSFRSEVSLRPSRALSTQHSHAHTHAPKPAAPLSPDSTSPHPPHHEHAHRAHQTSHKAAASKPPLAIPDLSEDDGLAAHMPTFNAEGQWDNPWPTWKAKTVLDIAKFLARGFKNNKLPSKAELDRYYPMHPPDVAALHSPHPQQLQATWVGHSTFLVQVDGLSFLTDPVWAEYASPIPFGPKRFRPPGVPLEKLPKIDFVLLSHNHYDHLDLSVVRHLGNSTKWYIPFGMKEWFYGENVTNVVELGWWEHAVHGADDAAVFMLPAQHWSKRTMWDERQALWGSFAVITPRHKVYFAGDTGYCTVFPEIGKRFGPFDLSLLPIGAYEPKEFMGPAHVDPGGAVDIHKDLKSRKSIGMHFGTFRLTNELAHEPPRHLLEELEARGVSPDDFFVINHGETVRFAKEGDKVTLL